MDSDREHGRVVIDPDIDPPGGASDVVDPIRDGLLHARSAEEEVVILDLDRFTGRSPLPPGHRATAPIPLPTPRSHGGRWSRSFRRLGPRCALHHGRAAGPRWQRPTAAGARSGAAATP